MIRQGIQTTYRTRDNGGGYIFAKCDGKSRIFNWDPSLEIGPNHVKAARFLADEMGWHWESFATGCLGANYFHVEYEA